MTKVLKAAALICAMAALSGCVSLLPPPPVAMVSSAGATYRLVPVRADTASQFYYAKSDVFVAAGATEAARRAEMAKRASFGPFNLPTEVRLMEDAAYDLFPRCDDAISWKDLVRVVVAPTTAVKLDCR